jgi:hypothetical protein
MPPKGRAGLNGQLIVGSPEEKTAVFCPGDPTPLVALEVKIFVSQLVMFNEAQKRQVFT